MQTPPGHPNLRFAAWVLPCALAEPLRRGEDLVGGFDPFVGFGIFIVRVGEGSDISFQFGHGPMYAPLSEPPRVYRRVELSKDEPYGTEEIAAEVHG